MKLTVFILVALVALACFIAILGSDGSVDLEMAFIQIGVLLAFLIFVVVPFVGTAAFVAWLLETVLDMRQSRRVLSEKVLQRIRNEPDFAHAIAMGESEN